MVSRDLKYWPIFSLLKSDFLSTIRMVIVYGTSGTKALIVTNDDMVYAVGSKLHRCFEINNEFSSLKPQKVEELCGKNIKTLVHGSGPYILALTHKGEICYWDHTGDIEQRRRYNGATATSTFVTIHSMEKVIEDIACGSHHFLALTNDGLVFAWGRNDSGQVSSKTTGIVNMLKKSVYSVKDQKIVGIACGHSFNIIVTQKGEVYGWGCNRGGQLGIGVFSCQAGVTKSTNLTNVVIVKVVCGAQHTLALSNRGVIYVWGVNSNGQLGLGDRINCCNPVKLHVQTVKEVLDVAASHCSNVSAALATDNRVFVWGECSGNSITFPLLTSLTRLYDAFPYYTSCKAMHRSLILCNEDNGINIMNHLQKAFDDPTTSDLTIQVEDKAIYVHKAILKIRSHYFRAMFQGCWTENNQNLLVHNHYSYDVYREYLKYLYTDNVDVPSEIAIELMDLANAYLELQLRKYCEEIVRKHLSVDNILQVYKKAIELNIKELEDCCFQFAFNHMTEVILTPSFIESDRSTLKTFVTRAAEEGAFKT